MANTYRIFNCALCFRLTIICSRCDRGQRYCRAQCSKLASEQQGRDSGRRYQSTDKGKLNHKVRQQTYLMRKEAKMTQQGSPNPPVALPPQKSQVTPAAPTKPTWRQEEPVEQTEKEEPRQVVGQAPSQQRCSFCGQRCGHFARRGPLRRRGRVHSSSRRPRLPRYGWGTA